MNSRTADPASVERDLAETRARLGQHLDELTRRLSPGQLVDEGLAYLRNGQGAAMVRNLGSDLRDNPLPVALTGMGLAWLVASTSLQRNAGSREHTSRSRAVVRYDESQAVSRRRADEMAERARRAGEAVTRAADETEEAFKTRVAEARARVIGLQREASETAAAFADRVQEGFEAAQRNARETFEDMRQTAGEWRDDLVAKGREGREAVGSAVQQGRDIAARASGGVAEVFSDNPLLLAALGLTAGALLGVLLPRSSQEDNLISPAVGKAVGAAREATEEMVARGSRAAEAAVSAGYQAAREQMAPEKPDTHH
jgi:hypothetical protein